MAILIDLTHTWKTVIGAEYEGSQHRQSESNPHVVLTTTRIDPIYV